jgi:hypothetical protein
MWERDMAGLLSENSLEPELRLADLLSALSCGASFEEIANFLIDHVTESGSFLSRTWAALDAAESAARHTRDLMVFPVNLSPHLRPKPRLASVRLQEGAMSGG